jgi:hypothetical protein
MNTNAKTEYDQDFYAWAMQNAERLRQGRFAELDSEHIAEELESMGKSERRALESHLSTVLRHLLKWRYQPGLRSPSWRQSIRNGRTAIAKIIADSPSLKSRLGDILTTEYPSARADAIDETGLPEAVFPQDCPFTLEQVLDPGYWPGN